MEIIKAFNYMKTIINNGMKRKSNTINVRKGLQDYLSVLTTEGAVTETDLKVLVGVVQRIDAIMKSELTADEAFVRSLCKEQNIKYTPVKQTTPAPKGNKQSSRKKSSGQTKKKRPEYHFSGIEKEDASQTIRRILKEAESEPARYSSPWSDWPIEPDGSCGRFDDARRKAAYEEWLEEHFSSDDGIPSKCRR